MILKDKIFRLPREWSNQELRQFGHLFEGRVINVSGWKDLDKEGNKYRDYFPNCSEYIVSNHPEKGKGFQNRPNEIMIDLEKDLRTNLQEQFDVVINHTTLEHLFNVRKAFENLCALTKDIIIIIVPFMQMGHGSGFEDYWRFTPECLKQAFKINGLDILYINYNDHKRTSVYIFSIASKKSEKWKNIITQPEFNRKKVSINTYYNRIGSRAIINGLLFRIKNKILSYFKKDIYY